VQEGDQGASLQFSYDGKWVLIRDEKNTVSMHPTVSSESELQLTNEPFSTVHFASNRLTLKSHETVHVYDHDTQTVLTQKADDAIVAPDLKLNSQPEDFILEIASRVGRDASELRMSTIAASQKFVAFGLPNGEILLWNKDTELLVPIPRTLPKGVDALCLSNDEKRLVAASVGTIVLFDTNSGIAVLTLKWKFAFIRFLGWFDEGKTLVAISMDGRIRTWAVQGSD
jgi:WD40 repeat protein